MQNFFSKPHPNQKGISSMVLLIVLVFGIIIIWELNEYIQFQVSPGNGANGTGSKNATGSATLCISGETGNCNDTNDVFLLP